VRVAAPEQIAEVLGSLLGKPCFAGVHYQSPLLRLGTAGSSGKDLERTLAINATSLPKTSS